MKTTNPKRIEITQQMIDSFAPGCSVNNPLTMALKEQVYLDATEIIIHGDEIYVDGRMLVPLPQTVQWMNDWHKGRKVKPSTLGYYEA